MIVYNKLNQGRLGNQLFFVASTIGIAKKNNTEWGFTSQLGYNNVDYQSIFKEKLPITTTIPEKKYYQNGFSFYDIEIDDVEIIGYFQSEKFFKNDIDLIKKQFEFKEEYVELVIKKYPNINKCLTTHVRRGDYLNQQDYHPIIPMKYYDKIISDIGNNYENIFIFSDDINWVKENFVNDKYIFPYFDIDDDLMCFILMSLGRDNIICNSTYSWWASWLNKNPYKKIYSPHYKNWFGPNYNNLDTKDIIPNDWIQIEY